MATPEQTEQRNRLLDALQKWIYTIIKAAEHGDIVYCASTTEAREELIKVCESLDNI